ncbi:MAG: glycosyltransferase [Bacteroidales bacterium]|nr:glycosyltransferase [Bacteroidales bacterium]
MKKIIVIGPAYPLRGGIAAFTERFASELNKQVADVSIITYSLQYPKFLFPGKTQLTTGENSCKVPIRIALNSINPINWMRLGLQLKKLKPDYIVFKFWLPFMAPALGTIARIAKKNKKTKCIGLAHNIVPHEKKISDHFLANYFVQAMDGFLVLSESVMKDLIRFEFQNAIRISPHPLYDHFGKALSKSVARKELNLDPDWKYLLFFGIIREYKGLDLALKAIASKKLKDLKIKLIVAGEFYCAEKPIFDLVDELGIKDRVIFQSEYIPDQIVPAYFSAADLIIQPYKQATQSGVTQIAYHFNKPVLVTKVGGLPELVHHRKVGYVSSLDTEDMAGFIHDFYTHNREAEFIPNILELKKIYSWDLFLNQLNLLLQELEAEK